MKAKLLICFSVALLLAAGCSAGKKTSMNELMLNGKTVLFGMGQDEIPDIFSDAAKEENGPELILTVDKEVNTDFGKTGKIRLRLLTGKLTESDGKLYGLYSAEMWFPDEDLASMEKLLRKHYGNYEKKEECSGVGTAIEALSPIKAETKAYQYYWKSHSFSALTEKEQENLKVRCEELTSGSGRPMYELTSEQQVVSIISEGSNEEKGVKLTIDALLYLLME